MPIILNPDPHDRIIRNCRLALLRPHNALPLLARVLQCGLIEGGPKTVNDCAMLSLRCPRTRGVTFARGPPGK
jgi:hypothetical protein